MLSNATVLVVDDSITARLFVDKILTQQMGCKKVIQAKSANEAMELINSGQRLDWIISDWEMPGMKGDEFLVNVRENPATADIPFIMMTSRNDKDAFVTAAQAGVSDFIIKPFNAAVLIQKVRKVFLSCERRVLARFKSTTKMPITVKFTKTQREGSLVDLSEGGCLAKMHLMKEGEGAHIYDTAEIVIMPDEADIRVKGELVRVERDKESNPPRQFVLAAFEFSDIDERNKARLMNTLSSLKTELPDEQVE